MLKSFSIFSSRTSKARLAFFSIALLICLLPITTQANENTLVIGTKIAAPFSMKNGDKWEGLSIDLWKEIANKLKINYTWKQLELPNLLKDVTDSKIDVGIAAITVTSEREKRFDFSHPYYSTGLSIAVPIENNNGWSNVIKGVFSFKMFQLVLMLLSILAAVGTLMWLMERGKNTEHFSKKPIKGIASGVWLAAVTMTTVGYGDISPKTLSGKIVTLIWMFVSLLLVSVIIAGVASTLAMSKLEPLVSGPEDLARARIGSIQDTTSAHYLLDRKILPTYFPTILGALEALERGDIDAVVYDAALLKYYIHQEFDRELQLYEGLFELQFYGIAFPENSPLREPVNRALLEIIEGDEWQATISNYLGR